MPAKTPKTIFVCGECGYESSKWLGRCPSCDSWGTLIEEREIQVRDTGLVHVQAVPLSLVPETNGYRCSTSIPELDRVLGGGIVTGSTILLGGDPGIGKSTLLMQVAIALSKKHKVLYVTGEESASQLKLRAQRLGLQSDMLLLNETDLDAIESELIRLKPDFLVIDSIQTMYSANLTSAPGSVSQVREATSMLTRYAKQTGCAVFIVGHVTKDGAIAGPRVLEHMVDSVLYFEGDRHDSFRLLRAVKNRYGSTNEIGIFEMRDIGMVEVPDTSDLFLTGSNNPGCAVTCAIEGTRPILVEVQSLLSTTAFGNPRRMSSGIDNNRLALLIAVLEKKAGLRLYDKDIYVNVVGGIKLDERASDLAIAMCIASAYKESPVPASTIVIGEMALTGEIRNASRLDKRVQECIRLGFKNIIIPVPSPRSEYPASTKGVNLIQINSIAQAVDLL